MPKDALGFDIVGDSSPAPQSSTPTPTTDPMGFPVVGGGAPAAPKTDPMGFAIVGSPENGQSAPPEQDTSIGDRFKAAWNDPSKGVLGHIWGVLNTPTVDVDSALGRTAQAGGVEKGANDLVSGLTSPLSIALTLGTFGLGGLVESGGMSALRAVGLGAPEIAEVTKGAQIVADATKSGKTFQEGLSAAQAAGVDPATLTKGLSALKDASLDSSSLLSKGIVRNGATQLASKVGLSAKAADTVGQGLQALVAGGFTVQQAQQAAELSPKVLDALRDGDYQQAERLGIDALGSAVLGGLGAHELAKESGGLMSDVAAKAGLKVKPSEENLKVRNEFGEYDKNVATAGRTAELWAQDLRKAYPKMDPTQLERVRYYVESGMDDSTMARRYNALAEAADRDDRVIPPESVVEGPRPENGQAPAAPQTPISTGMSADRLQEVIDSKQLAAKYKPAEIDKLLDAYDPSKLTDADKELATKIRDQFSNTLEYATKNGALGDGVKNYVTSLWEKGDENNPATNMLAHDANTGAFTTNTSQARSRVFDSSFEGQLFGKKLAETDPITLAAHNASIFAHAVEARKAVERLADSGTRASDGRPMVTLAGEGHPADDNSVFVNPNGNRSIKIADNVVQGLKDSGDLDKLVKDGKIVNLTRTVHPENIQAAIDRLENSMVGAQPKFDAEGNSILRQTIDNLKGVRDGRLPKSVLDEFNAQRPDSYGWSDNDYSVLDHPAMKGWNHLTQSPSGDSVIMKADMRVHPEAKTYLERRLGVDSQGPGDNPIGKALLTGNKELKGALLFGSPFHVAQEGLRAVMSGVSPSPFNLDKWDLANDPVLSRGVQNGLTLGRDYKSRSAFSDGQLEAHSSLIGKIPVLKNIQSGLDRFLFQRYIPALKARAYSSLVDRYQAAYPDWTPDRAAASAASDVNERFGGINYRRLGRAAATQNWAKLGFLASDWMEGEIRAIGRPFGTEGAIARQDLLRISAYMWGAARILNLVNTGKPHMEAPFGVVNTGKDGKDTVYSMRSLPSDLLHAVSDPLGFMRGRVSPTARVTNEMYTGRDNYGRKLPPDEIWTDVLRNQLPIPVQSVGKALSGTGPDIGNTGQIVQGLGGTAMTYRTEAQKVAAQLASNRSESGPVDQGQLARHQVLMSFEDKIRSGEMQLPQVYKLVMDGQLPQADAKKIADNVKMTHGMPADVASLYTRASRLQAPDLLKVWDSGTVTEKATLTPLLIKARKAYYQHSLKNMTPAERQNDPTLLRLRQMFPNEAPW